MRYVQKVQHEVCYQLLGLVVLAVATFTDAMLLIDGASRESPPGYYYLHYLDYEHPTRGTHVDASHLVWVFGYAGCTARPGTT